MTCLSVLSWGSYTIVACTQPSGFVDLYLAVAGHYVAVAVGAMLAV